MYTIQIYIYTYKIKYVCVCAYLHKPAKNIILSTRMMMTITDQTGGGSDDDDDDDVKPDQTKRFPCLNCITTHDQCYTRAIAAVARPSPPIMTDDNELIYTRNGGYIPGPLWSKYYIIDMNITRESSMQYILYYNYTSL